MNRWTTKGFLIVQTLSRKLATISERGLAAEIREKYKVSKSDRKILHNIVHEQHDKPTLLQIPTNNYTWTLNKKWKSNKHSDSNSSNSISI